MLERVSRTIRKFHMVLPGQRIAVACSGGPDSTALLLLLRELADRLACTLSVAHLNHQLRAEQSGQDEEFVRRLAERLQLPFHVERAEVARSARETHTNLEQKARQVRYRFFLSLLESGRADRVAVGHTADDQCETVVQRFLRGAGTRGLAGIYPVVEGKIVRPLIQVRRPDVLDWLQERQQPWQSDSSNEDLSFSRNRIRRQVLPLLSQFNPRLVESLADLSEIARAEEWFWEAYLQPLVPEMVQRERQRVLVDIRRLRKLPLAVGRRVLRRAVDMAVEVSEGPQKGRSWATASGVDFEHIEQILGLASEGQSGTSISLPLRLEARKEFGHLILERSAAAAPQAVRDYSYRVEVPGRVPVPEIGRSFVFELIPLSPAGARYNKKEGLLDCRVAEACLTLRNWRPGDLYRPTGHGRRKKLKELFQRNRIPLRERAAWPVLVAGDRILWAGRLGAAEGFTPPEGSRQAILIRECTL